jgi:hypothetical protein
MIYADDQLVMSEKINQSSFFVLSRQTHCLLLMIFMMYLSTSGARASDADTVVAPPRRSVSLRDTLTTHHKTDLIELVKIIVGIKEKKVKRRSDTTQHFFYSAYIYPGYALVTGFAAIGMINVEYRPKKIKRAIYLS